MACSALGRRTTRDIKIENRFNLPIIFSTSGQIPLILFFCNAILLSQYQLALLCCIAILLEVLFQLSVYNIVKAANAHMTE